jgi:hypothetical protein
LNAALWFGATLFFTFAVGPAFFTPQTLALFGVSQNEAIARFYAGSMAQIVMERYFILQYICGGIALLHLLADWLYTGRRVHPLQKYVVWGLCGLILIGGIILQPALHKYHRIQYGLGVRVTVQQVEQARHSFRTLHGISMVMNLFVVGGTLFYFCKMLPGESGPRFLSRSKYGTP